MAPSEPHSTLVDIACFWCSVTGSLTNGLFMMNDIHVCDNACCYEHLTSPYHPKLLVLQASHP
jgi:hypothetical protein